MTDNHGGVTTVSDDNVNGNCMLTCQCYVPSFDGDGFYPAGTGDVDGKVTWQLNNNHGGVTTEVNSMLTWLMDGDGELTPETKSMLTWHINNNNGGATTVNGDGNSSVNGDGEVVTDEMKSMLTCQSEFVTNKMLTWQNEDKRGLLTCHLEANEFNRDGEVVTDESQSMLTWQNADTKGMLTCQSEFNGENEMLTWQNNEEDEEEISKFLEASDKMLTCQNSKVKIINDYPYWLPLKFQTSSAYVTINGNEELCGSSFSDSDTSYMAGISGGAWGGVAEDARGEMEVEWGECEDEMLASFLGE